ncbi:MAG: DUF402 domain-containing protein [Lachnospiraceae bacterium]|nr:DUF402 domain-containing protein [Lachnospiraceae bacterium]
MSYPKIYRKRLIPSECVLLDRDIIHQWDSDMIVTSWNTIRPKKELHHGKSVYYLKEGWKISRFKRADDSLMYTYCDIISIDRDDKEDALTVTDLLADVIIYPDGFVKVVDLDELAQAVREGLMTGEELNTCLITLNSLLSHIYKGELDQLTSPLDQY